MLMLWFLMSFRERRRVDRFGPGRDLWRAPWLAAQPPRTVGAADDACGARAFGPPDVPALASRDRGDAPRPPGAESGTRRGKPRAGACCFGD
jgi:hypothetical protein